ncbi:recombinase family protein [Streptomyces cinereoruber]|uniref:recombinase family protein n=1 Tax=Streptomyces cinereoruber TaxID=67260 RepID=UPI00363A156A
MGPSAPGSRQAASVSLGPAGTAVHKVSSRLRTLPLGERGIGQDIDTFTMEDRAMFGMLSVLAELQRELIMANTNDGLASVRARSPVGRRRSKLTADQAALAHELYDARKKTV